MNLNDIKTAYFVGIGGIGMSAIARYFKGQGVEVHGYDKTSTELTQTLENEGVIIHYEDNLSYIPKDVDLVVYTPAIPQNHGELTYFIENNYVVKKRAEVLGIISRAKKAIAVAGTHGKTTTSSIITHLLRTANLDCSAFLGGIAQNFASNFVAGKSDWVVVEADEFDRSFLQLNPTISVVMSMDADHLDIYGDINQMHSGFREFITRTQSSGYVFYRHGLPLNPNLESDVQVFTFGLEAGDFRATHIRVEAGYFVFDFESPIQNWTGLKFALPGQHNVENATVAIAIAQILGLEEAAIRHALTTFKGIKRRFEMVLRTDDAVLIDDYAHHPTELKAAIRAARTLYPNQKITGIFQPHLYTRTRDFVEGFAEALDALDEIFLLDIYPARELPIENVTSQIILDKMQNPNKKLVNKSNLLSNLNLNDASVVLVLGAGDIDTLVQPIRSMWLKIKEIRLKK